MATENPMGDGPVVTLAIPADGLRFLRRVVGAAREGLREELAECGLQLRKPRSTLLLEETAYAVVLEAIDGEAILPDDEIEVAVRRLAEAVDRDNEYARAAEEHLAFAELLRQLEGAGPR